MNYHALLVALAIDLFAITVLTYAIYFRRHRRRDLTLGFMGVNVGLFAAASFIANGDVSVGFGIGLFALLSVIRLRSTPITQEEIGYYFVALVLGLVNGVAPEESWARTVVLNVLLIGVMFVADHPRMLQHYDRRIVVPDDIHRKEEALRRDVEQRIGFEVVRLRVLDVDYVRERTRVDARFRTDRPVAPKPKKHKPPKVVPAEPEPPSQVATEPEPTGVEESAITGPEPSSATADPEPLLETADPEPLPADLDPVPGATDAAGSRRPPLALPPTDVS